MMVQWPKAFVRTKENLEVVQKIVTNSLESFGPYTRRTYFLVVSYTMVFLRYNSRQVSPTSPFKSIDNFNLVSIVKCYVFIYGF